MGMDGVVRDRDNADIRFVLYCIRNHSNSVAVLSDACLMHHLISIPSTAEQRIKAEPIFPVPGSPIGAFEISSPPLTLLYNRQLLSISTFTVHKRARCRSTIRYRP